MAVLEADSEALWPSDEDNELLSAVREHTDDNILSAQTCEASGWEKTKVNSLLSQHCQSYVMNRRSKQRHTTHLPPLLDGVKFIMTGLLFNTTPQSTGE